MTKQLEALRVALKTFEQIENHPRSIWDCSSEIELLRCAIDELSRQSEAPVVPEGWKLAPPEPDQIMLNAAACVSGDDWKPETGVSEGHSYRKHIARKEYMAMFKVLPNQLEGSKMNTHTEATRTEQPLQAYCESCGKTEASFRENDETCEDLCCDECHLVIATVWGRRAQPTTKGE